ncbi:MAG: DNA polymerase IV [bacterium]
MGVRKILHLDLDAFFCAVEELKNPSLKHRVFAVGGRADQRGVVSTCSYAARALGIHSAMPMAQAQKLAPALLVLPPDFEAYSTASDQVMAILEDLSPLVEQVSVDEAFIDVSDLPDDPGVIAARLQARINQETRLPCSLGVAANKLVAKVANDYGKGSRKGLDYPNAITVVPPGEEAAFLAPLPVQMLWGVGKKTAARLKTLGIETIGQLADAPAGLLGAHYGKWVADMQRHARGISDSPIVLSHTLKSISNETTYDKDIGDIDEVLHTVRWLSDKVGYRLRKHHFCAGTIRIKLRWSDFTTITRQVALAEPTNHNSVIYDTAAGLLRAAWQRGRKVRLIGVGSSNLQEPAVQMSLFDPGQDKETKLLNALDELREKYGKKVIQRGREVGRQSALEEEEEE